MEMWQQQSAHGLVLLSGLRWLWEHEGERPQTWQLAHPFQPSHSSEPH